MVEEFMNDLNQIEFVSDEDIDNASFEELAIYLQTLNTVEEAVTGILEGVDNDGYSINNEQ